MRKFLFARTARKHKFVLVHIGVVGGHSGEVTKGGGTTNRGAFGTLGGSFWYFGGGGVYGGVFFGTKWGVFLVSTRPTVCPAVNMFIQCAR